MLRRLFATGGSAFLVASVAFWSPVVAAPALAYDNQGDCQTAETDGGSDHAGGQAFGFHAHFHKNSSTQDCKSNPDSNDDTTFSEDSGPSALAGHGAPLAAIGSGGLVAATRCQATFSPATARTDALGNVNTTVTLPAGCPGSYVLAATTASGLRVTVTVRETGGFPLTSTDGASSTRAGFPSVPALGLMAGCSALLLLAGLMFSRRRRSNL
jgi:hypothetical protein